MIKVNINTSGLDNEVTLTPDQYNYVMCLRLVPWPRIIV